MIVGIGSDIIDIRRIEALLRRFGARLEMRLFTARERDYARAHSMPAAAYAKRFAAKEAAAKALGRGMRGFAWQEIEVINDAVGKPSLMLHGNARKQAERLTQGAVRAHVSLSDEPPYALAFVIIEA